MGELCGREVDSRDPGSSFGEVYSGLPAAAGNLQNVLSRNVGAGIFNSRSGGMDGPHSTSSSSSPRWLFW